MVKLAYQSQSGADYTRRRMMSAFKKRTAGVMAALAARSLAAGLSLTAFCCVAEARNAAEELQVLYECSFRSENIDVMYGYLDDPVSVGVQSDESGAQVIFN